MAVDIADQRRRARASLQGGSFAEAHELFIQVVNADPYDARSWSDLAECLLRLADVYEAFYCCHVAIQIDPNQAHPWYVLAETFFAHHQPGQAWAAYRTAMQQQGLDAEQERQARSRMAIIERDVDAGFSA